MENRKIATLEIKNSRVYVPAVLSFIDSLTSQHNNFDIQNYNKLRFVVTEMLTNRINSAYPNSTGILYVDITVKDNYLEIAVRDKGVPHWIDFSYNEDLITSESKDFQRFILDKCIDSAGIEKLGKDGQKIYVRQKLRQPIHFKPPVPYQEETALDTNISIKAVENEEDAIEAIRCIYSEYGYSYAYEKLYFVDNLLRMIKSGEIMCFLAVNEHGQTAGHFALAFSDLYKNMPELSTVVTRKAFRGLGLFAKFIDHAERICKEKGVRAIMAQPVAFHPISQKAFLKSGYTATSLLLSYISSDIESEYNKNGERLDLFSCVKVLDKNASCTLYPPAETKDFVTKIYDRLGIKAEIKDEYHQGSTTLVSIESNSNLKLKRLIVTAGGEDIEEIIVNAVKDSVRKKQEMIELFISMRDQSCAYTYNIAKNRRFAISGLMPGGENDDYIIMQFLIKNERHYDQLVTVGEFEELTNDIVEIVGKE